MANINEAYNTQKSQDNNKYDNYMDKLKGKIDNQESTYYPNSINHEFSDLNTAYSRVKVSNEKYDKIMRQHNKPIYGFICQACNGSVDQHFYLQTKSPHPFVKGQYRKLEPDEMGPFF
ncbi:hypothetical protein Klosneuvirus_1_185 [Klosneuvirus KNV1]|uniref:Uncharacterized protein n=1 Tax=Klosneuvirus KNV1 TaxID=1977640 RepID=A0A1V0SI70_9VIRU|nr:hypothetical protein Klosneuvirus_1_185 [Klosneuvirus KNV1]